MRVNYIVLEPLFFYARVNGRLARQSFWRDCPPVVFIRLLCGGLAGLSSLPCLSRLTKSYSFYDWIPVFRKY